MKTLPSSFLLSLVVFSTLLTMLGPSRVHASCVINQSGADLWIEFYGTRVKTPTFDRGGEWLKSGEGLCNDGVGGDWLVLPPDWLYGKPAEWKRREENRLGGTDAYPRYSPAFINLGPDDTVECSGFLKHKDFRGWWVFAECAK